MQRQNQCPSRRYVEGLVVWAVSQLLACPLAERGAGGLILCPSEASKLRALWGARNVLDLCL